jgi:4-amino-4-deoxy-L-arabinose transferase-like glycosyltransferase
MHLLAGIVGVSFALRAVGALAKATPVYYPDEYMYAELGRSLVESGRPLVRGADSSFPALLQPLVTAPAWTLDDVADAYRLVQLLGALAMSLAAIPVFYLALRLGLGRGLALGFAALAVAFPSLMYASWILAEPFAYPLLLAAVYAGTVALARPGRRAALAFVLLTGLATLARAQFALLPVCFFLGVVALGVQGRALARELRAQVLPLALFAVPLALLVAAPAFVGMYGGFLDLDLGPTGLAKRVGMNAMGLMYGSGWILVPGACVGIALALARTRSRAELAFGTLVLTLTAGLILQASLYGDTDRIQERYTFYAAPLLALAFGLWAGRGWPWRRAHALLAVGALLVSMLIPLSGYVAAFGKTQSPFLLAVGELERMLGDGSAGTASLVVAITVGALSAVAIGASRLQPRSATVIAISLALALCLAASTGATLFDTNNSRDVRTSFLPSERSWVDATGLDDVALLHGFARRTEASAQLFWNRSVDEVLLLPATVAPDSFSASKTLIGADGRLTVNGRPVRRPLLVDEAATLIELRGARLVATGRNYRLWTPAGIPRFAFRFSGYFQDGWLGPRGTISLWPPRPGGRVKGTVTFKVTAPAIDRPTNLRLAAPGRKVVELHLAPGSSRTLEVPICAQGEWHAFLAFDRSTYDGGRFVSVRSTRPTLERDSSAC